MRDFTVLKGDVVRKKAEGTCKWCGSPAKYKYGYLSPMLQVTWDLWSFCSISCRRNYAGC